MDVSALFLVLGRTGANRAKSIFRTKNAAKVGKNCQLQEVLLGRRTCAKLDMGHKILSKGLRNSINAYRATA